MSKDDSASDKPAILQESEFVVEEGILHRVFRTGAIWMNKLFFSAAFLWAVWLLVAFVQGYEDCAPGIGQQGENASQDLDIVAEGHCSVLLTVTSKYLGSMVVLSFVTSIGFGILGLVIGKRVIEAVPASQEAGARERVETARDADAQDAPDTQDAPQDGPESRDEEPDRRHDRP